VKVRRLDTRLKPIDYEQDSFYRKSAPPMASEKEPFYVIREQATGEYLHKNYENDSFGKADPLSLEDVRRFREPTNYSGVYHVPHGKRRERFMHLQPSLRTHTLQFR
jgi:hypothetical protein